MMQMYQSVLQSIDESSSLECADAWAAQLGTLKSRSSRRLRSKKSCYTKAVGQRGNQQVTPQGSAASSNPLLMNVRTSPTGTISGPSHAGSAADSKAVHEEVQHLHTELRSLALRMSGIEIQVAGLAAEYQEHMGLQATRHAQLLEGMVLLNARHAQQGGAWVQIAWPLSIAISAAMLSVALKGWRAG